MCGYMVVSSRREYSRWHVLIVHVLGWCWLPCMRILLILYLIMQIMFIYLACKHIHCVHFHPMHHLHKHLRTCIIQDRQQIIQSSHPWSQKSSSRCSHRRCPRPMRRTLRNFRSAPITARVPSREASPGAFLPRFANIQLMFYFNWCITFRSCLQPLLHYTLFTFAIPYPCYPGIRSRVSA
jgi:hypothetical protein